MRSSDAQETSAHPRENRPEPAPTAEEELQTIRLATGERWAGLEALRLRSQGAPHRRAVPVTLLNSHSAPGPDHSLRNASGNYSSNMDRVSELTETLQTLLQQHRGLSGTEQTLHRLETLQLSLQNQLLLDSALKMALRPQDQPPATVTMETQAPPCKCEQAAHSVSPVPHTVTAPRETEEARSGAEQVLKELQSLRSELKSVLTPQDDAEKSPQPRPSSSRQTQKLQTQKLQTFNRVPQIHRKNQRSLVRTLNPPQTSPRSPNPAHISAGSVRSEEVQTQTDNKLKQTREKWTQSERAEQDTEKNGAKREELRDRSSLVTSPGLKSVPSATEGPPSVLEQARSVLKKVQRQRKVLEENLESQIRARSGELLLCQLDALSQNRDCSDEVRIKKTVDGFIQDIQAEMKMSTTKPKASSNRNADRRQIPPSANRKAVNRRQMAPLADKNAADRRQVHPSANRSTASRRGAVYLVHGNVADRRNPTVSGRPIRTNATEALDSAPELVPGLVLDQDLDPKESLYGNALQHGQRRSLKSPYVRLSSPEQRPRPLSRPQLLQCVRGVKLKSCETQTYDPDPGPVPGLGPGLGPGPGCVPAEAVPLVCHRTDSAHRDSPLPPQQEVTLERQSLHQMEMTECLEQRSDPPQVNIVTPPPLHQEEEEAEFPGTRFLSVTELQQSEVDCPEGPEEVLQLEGGSSPDQVPYEGPHFPPVAPPALDQSRGLELDFTRAALEEQLVQWVEQQIMSRIITDMSRPRLSDPTHSHYTAQSDPPQRPEPAHLPSPVQSEPSAVSNHRFQLRLESSLDLDPEQIRGLVLEVLTEIVALFLGSRESQDPETEPRPGPEPEAETGPRPKPEPGSVRDPQTQPETQEILIPTPLATPPQTPPPVGQSPPPAVCPSVTTPRATPPLPDSPSPAEGPSFVRRPTPTSTPTPEVITDLPLVETEDKPKATPPPDRSPASVIVAPPPDAPSPPDSSSSSSSSSSTVSSRTSATPLRHISEGEVLQSHLQDGYEENVDFSSSLQELQEMDLDPPSEGQVHSRSVLLNLVNRLQQREPRPQPEGSWGRGLEEEEEMSAGEVRDNILNKVTDQRSPGQASPIPAEVLEWTNQSAVSEWLLSPLDQADSPKLHSELGLDLVQEQTQMQQSSDYPPVQDQDQPKSQSQDQSAQTPGVGVERGLLKVDVLIPKLDTESSGVSESSSDTF